MNAITKEKLVNWINDRLGLVYLGLTQLADCPGYWEAYYEDEMEPLESIRALLAPPVAPVRVTRELLESLEMTLEDGGGNDVRAIPSGDVEALLKELGVIVEEG